MADHKPFSKLVVANYLCSRYMQWAASLGKWPSYHVIPPTHPISMEVMGREVSGKQHTCYGCCTYLFIMLKLRFGFTCCLLIIVYPCKYPTRRCFSTWVSNSFLICYILLLYICSSQGCIAAPIVLIILDTVSFVVIKGSSPEAKPTSFVC